MDIATRAFNASALRWFDQIDLTRLFAFELSKILKWLAVLLVSAVITLYVQDLHRRLFVQMHGLQRQTYQLRIERDKLRLEKATWSNPARVQVAAQRLHMSVPNAKEIVLVHMPVSEG